MNTAAKLVLGVLGGRGGATPAPVITTSSIPDAGVGVAYSTTLAADNSPTSWSVVVTDYDGTDITSGCGLSINSSGVLSGTPAIPAGSDGLWTVTVTASNAGGASAPAVYTIECWQLLVNFSTDDAAPVASPYAGEFGSVTITDTGNNASVSGGKLTWNTVVAGLDPQVVASTERVTGRAYICLDTVTPGRTVLLAGIGLEPNNSHYVDSVPVQSSSATFTGMFIATSDGIVVYRKNATPEWELLWTSYSTIAISAFSFYTVNTNGVRELSSMRIINTPITARYQYATFNVTSAFSDVRTGTANAEITHEYSIPSPDAANDEISVIYRRQDASNYWRARIVRNAGDTNYDLLVDSVASGTPTNRLTVSNIGNTDALRIRADGNTIRFFTRSGTVWTSRSSVTLSLYSAETGVTSTVVQGSWTQTRLVSVPLTDATVTAILDRVTA